MAEVDIGSSGGHSVHGQGQIAPLADTPVVAAPKGHSTNDSLGRSSGTAQTKGVDAYSPELMQALYMLYFSGNNNPHIVELYLGGGKKTDGVGATGAADKGVKPINVELFDLQMKNRMNQICVNMLTAWNKSIAEENTRIKKEQASPAHQEWEKRQGHAGFDAWLGTLSSEQRLKVLEFPKYDRIVGVNDSISNMLTSYTQHLRADPSSSENLPFLASAITLGLSTHYDYAQIPDASSGQISMNPIRDSSAQVLTPLVSSNAAELAGMLGGMIAQASALHATARVLASQGSEPVINQQYAKAFAQDILSQVAGPGFAALAAGLFVDKSEGADPTHNAQRTTDLLRASLLSTGLALMYRTESSIDGVGGGMTGQEFKDLVEGNIDISNGDPKMAQIAGYVKTILGYLSPDDKAQFYLAFGNFIDSTPRVSDWLQLNHIRGLLQSSTEAPILPV